MAAKQINLYKDKMGKVTGMTIFYWGTQEPSILFYDPPRELRLALKEITKKKKKKLTTR